MNTDQRDCQIEQIASYLDGELDSAASLLFEGHVKECSRCAAELGEQRRLLGALDSVLSRSSALPLPRNFAHVVATHAESDMSGMRGRRERGRALRWCAILAAASFALLGVATRAYVFNFMRKIGRPIAVVLDLFWTTIYDAVTGLAVISRVLSKSFVPGSLAGFLLLALAVLLLSRLISNYHRTRLID